MLPKKHRLKKNRDIKGVLKQGEGFKEGFLILKIKNNNSNFSRFAFLISLKISKKAAVRNRLKRKLREIIRLDLRQIRSGIDAVLIISSNFSAKSDKEIKGLINRLFIKAKLW